MEQPEQDGHRLTREWPTVRIVHLQGGCRAISGPDRLVEFEPWSTSGKVARFSLSSYEDLFPALASLRIRAIGADFLFDKSHVDGSRPSDWRTYHDVTATIWPTAEQADSWGFLAHGAFQAKNGELWDICSRVSYQLRVCQWRIREVSESYQKQLTSKLIDKPFKDGSRFENLFTWLCYLTVQSFLVDACVLRDYLAEYYWHVLHLKGAVTAPRRVSRMSVFKSKYLDKTTPVDPVDVALSEATAEGGWMHELGAYRDLVVHVAPLAKAGRGLYAVTKVVPIASTGALPSIKLPLPPNPKTITDDRVSGRHFSDPEMDFARFKRALEDPSATIDCLDYAHSVMGRLSYLAWLLAKHSPVPAIIPDLTSEIIDIKRVADEGSD